MGLLFFSLLNVCESENHVDCRQPLSEKTKKIQNDKLQKTGAENDNTTPPAGQTAELQFFSRAHVKMRNTK